MISTLIIPFSTKYFIPIRKSLSGILFVDHHFALFFTQCGIPLGLSELESTKPTLMILFFIRNCIEEMNSESVILSFAHHPAVFFIQSGSSLVVYSKVSGFSVGV